MTLLEKVNLLYNTSRTDVASFLEAASTHVANNLPYELISKYFTQVEMNDDGGLQITGVFGDIFRWKYKCNRIGLHLIPLTQDRFSEHYAGKYNPAYYILSGLLKVLPAPTATEKAYVSTIPTGAIDLNETTIYSYGRELENLILLYASYLISFNDSSNYKATIADNIESMREGIDSFSTSNSSFEVEKQVFTTTAVLPTVPDLSTILDAIAEIYVGDAGTLTAIKINRADITPPELGITLSAPSFVFEIDEDTPILNYADVELNLEDALSTLGSLTNKTSPNASFWLDDEDPEMVNSAVTIANSHLAIAKSNLEKNASNYATYNQAVNAKYGVLKGNIDKYIAELDSEMKRIQSEIQIYQTELQSYVSSASSMAQSVQIDLAINKSNLESRISSINSNLSDFQAKLQAYTSQIQVDLQLYSSKVQENLQIASINMNLLQMKLSEVQLYSNTIQSIGTEYQISSATTAALYQRYVSDYSAYLQLNGYMQNDSRESNTASRKR